MHPKNDPNVEFWCFLSRGYVQQHNRDAGMICSLKYLRLADYPNFGHPDASYLPFVPNPDFKGAVSFFQANVTSEYGLEYNLELARLAHYPDRPSRLSALYMFADRHEASKADRLYGWSHHADLVRLRPVNPHILCNYSRHDMEFISMARSGNIIGEDLDFMTKSYWEGKACEGMMHRGVRLRSEPVWGILYDGALTFMD